MPDGTYRLETNKPIGTTPDKLLMEGVRRMCVSESTVCEPGKVATLKVNDEGKVKAFERKYPWLDEDGEQEKKQPV